jgi:LmbE family N-acetylglucosaminyl deacetylase
MSSALLYLSPHLDDVVFSCAGKILQDVACGRNVTIATVFSSGSKQVSEEYEGRKAEDKKALEMLGVQCVWMEYPDAPFRSGFYNSFRRIILERDVEDNFEYVIQLRRAIEELAISLGAEEIHAPLGIGTHIDHRLAFDAASGLTGRSITYYEERPYVFARHAARMRLRSLGAVYDNEISMTDRDVGEYIESLCSLPYVEKYLPAGKERTYCLNAIAEDLKHPPVVLLRAFQKVVPVDEYTLLQIRATIEAYHSQVKDFFGTVEKYVNDSREYANHISGVASYLERYWQLWRE